MTNPDIPLIYRTYAERRVVIESDPQRYARIMAVQRRFRTSRAAHPTRRDDPAS